jgi:phosphatidate cytidylyltransferase
MDASAKFDLFFLLLIVVAESVIWGRRSSRWQRASLLYIGLVFLYYACYSLLNYYRDPLQSVFPPHDNWLVGEMGIITILASIFLCDSAAFFAGSLWGRRQLSSISPRKTIEGSVAGLAVAVVVSTFGWLFFAAPRYPVYAGVILGMLIGVAGQAGDLLVSLMKRYFRVKDASDLIPGHGGVLDRFDSLFFTAPILHLFFIVVVRLY